MTKAADEKSDLMQTNKFLAIDIKQLGFNQKLIILKLVIHVRKKKKKQVCETSLFVDVIMHFPRALRFKVFRSLYSLDYLENCVRHRFKQSYIKA